MSMVHRTFECAFGHRWRALVDRNSPREFVGECAECNDIVATHMQAALHEPADARSETQGAPLIRSERAKAVARFEHHAFKRPHFDDGRPLLTNLRDNVREGETYAVPETSSTNETMRVMRDQIEQARARGYETPGGEQMAAMGGGWGSPGALPLGNLGGGIGHMLPAVDLQSKNKPA